MKRLVQVIVLLAVLSGPGFAAEKPGAKEALQPFQELIGSWRCTGEPFGTREEKLKGFWQEKSAWQWQFKGDEVWLLATIDKGKYFLSEELRYLPTRGVYQMRATTPEKETLTFEGKLEKRKLTLERTDPKTKKQQRVVVSLLHSNRFLTRYEVRGPEQVSFTPVYQIGCTKEGVAFAGGDTGPECVVSGGKGTMPVAYKGKTYYVCCSGCRDAFRDEPEKYIAEFEAKKRNKD